MTAIKKIGKMDHVAVMVSDLDRSYHFYHDLLGLEKLEYVEHPMPGSTNIEGVSKMTGFPDVRVREYRMTLPENPGMTLDLIEWITPKSPVGRYPLHHVPSAHICFNVDDIEATYKYLKMGLMETNDFDGNIYKFIGKNQLLIFNAQWLA